VSAKDLGTGNEHKITITANTNLSEDEIQKAVNEADKFAEEDKKKKEEIEVKNNADSLIYNTEKTLKDLGDKVTAEEKSKVEEELNNVKEKVKGDNIEEIKVATEKLTQVFYEISSKLYQQAGAQQPNPGASSSDNQAQDAGKQENVYDADYKVVDEDK